MSKAKAPVLLRREEGVAHVVLDRAEARNALNLPMCLALKEMFEELDADADIRADHFQDVREFRAAFA